MQDIDAIRRKRALILCVPLAVIGVVVGTFFGIRAIIRANTVAPFKKHIEGYMAGGEPAPANPNALKKEIMKPKGKMIPVDVGEKAIDYIYFDLPGELRPATPEEVGTVVLLQWGKDRVFEYNNNPNLPAYQETVQITVLDMETRAVIGQSQLRGSMPPQIRSRTMSGTGSRPSTEIVNYLKALSR
jgi:hypothetical protein